MTSEYQWLNTLDQYLHASNEDERIVRFLHEDILMRQDSPAQAHTLHWLDVGPGIGTKTMRVAEALAQSPTLDRSTITLVDPVFFHHPAIARSLETRLSQLGARVQVFPRTIEEELRDPSWPGFDCTLMTAIHVAYSAAIATALLCLALEHPVGSRRVSVVICEAEQSAFSELRRELARSGVQVPASSLCVIEEAVTSSGVDSSRFDIGGQWCTVAGARSSDDHWLFPFLLGLDPEDFKSRPEQFQSHIRGTVRRALKEFDPERLSVPDTGLLIESTNAPKGAG